MEREAGRWALWIVIITICAVAVLAYLALTRSAHAQGQLCAPRSVMIAELAARYDEKLTVQGLSDDGSLVEIYAASDGRTWTMLRIRPPLNLACVVTSGQHLEIKDLPGRGL